MNLVERNTPGPGEFTSPENERAFLGISYVQTQRIVAALEQNGSTVLLQGEPGSGKSYLAQAAAYEIATRADSAMHCAVMRSFDELLMYCHLQDFVGTAWELCEALLLGLEVHAEGNETLVVALHVDRYSPAEAAAIELLSRTRRIRLIATAHQIIGAADRLVRDPALHQVTVEPLSITETNTFLAQILGVEHIAEQTLLRWYDSTHGNPYALSTLAHSATRRGVVQRARKIAWVPPRDDHPPADLIVQIGELSPLEMATLEFVSFASPVSEPELFHLLDATAVSTLMQRQILTVSKNFEGGSALCTRLPLLQESVSTHLSPLRRTELAAECFDAMLGSDDTLTGDSRLRLVRFGLEAGRELPVDWVWQAMKGYAHSGSLQLILRLALTAMSHPNPARATEAALRASDLAHFLGDNTAIGRSFAQITQIIADRDLFEAMPFETQHMLVGRAICYDPMLHTNPDLTATEFIKWEQYWQAKGIEAHRVTRACRMRIFALNGRLREALEFGADEEAPRSLEVAWQSAPARTFEALLRAQRGEFERAIDIAQSTRQIIMLHEISPTISGDLEGFTVFLANWARGTTHSARIALNKMASANRAELTAVHAQTGFVDLAVIMFSQQEARWYDAADIAERLFTTLASNDPFGITPLVHALHSLSLAALGFEDRAKDELLKSELRVPGLSLALQGFADMVRLRTRHWLRSPDLAEQALGLATWAQTEDLPLIELKALDVYAYQTGQLPTEQHERVRLLAEQVDQPIGDAILAHIFALINPQAGGPEPEERLLSELGVWMPLPPVKDLSGREREIALFTALGHSSKYIAERLHLSARTIETHLAHVYVKLGVDGREGLRRWFSHRREQE